MVRVIANASLIGGTPLLEWGNALRVVASSRLIWHLTHPSRVPVGTCRQHCFPSATWLKGAGDQQALGRWYRGPAVTRKHVFVHNWLLFSQENSYVRR